MRTFSRCVVCVGLLGLFVLHGAAQQARVFTTGTPSELALARTNGLRYFQDNAATYGLTGPNDVTVARVEVDRLSMAHTRVQQLYRGVRVFGGEAIAHYRADGTLFGETNDFMPNISVDVAPTYSTDAAIAVATAAYGCSACLTSPPASDLWILRDGSIDRLVYRVQLARIDGTAATALPVIFVDAHNLEVVWRYDNLQSGTGNSLYSGVVPVTTTLHGAIYSLENLVRRVGTFDMRNGSSSIYDFTDSDDVWNSSTQRAAVDVHWGTERYLDYLMNVHGRNGVDGGGGPFTVPSYDGTKTLFSSLVHFGFNYNNASWDPVNHLMIYGDGDGVTFSPIVSLDVIGHENTHGLDQYTANLTYSGESGALNESWSDVFGAMTERFVRGESANTWMIGEEPYTPAISGDALRYMDDPHRDPNSGYTADDDPDHYSERYTGSSDNGGVHVNSGIANKAFYLLAKGGTHHLGGSMAGIGADAAARIWYVALSSYMTSSTNFAGARMATLSAAAALYGSGSTPYAAVASAWCLVGVGVCGVPTADSVTPSSGTGASQTFAFRYSDTAGASNLTQVWVWFNSTFASTSANSCLVYYVQATNTVNLINDAGTAWMSAALGGGTLQNSSCAIALGSSTAASSGNTLTLNLAMTFKPAFAGAKNIYMYATNATQNSDWQMRGMWTVPAGATPVLTVDSVAPNSGSGASQTFALQYSDTAGAADLTQTWVWFNATFANSAANSCLLYYVRATNTLNLINDAGTGWMSGALGSGTLQNSACSVALDGSSAPAVGNTLTLNLALTFAGGFAGTKNIYMYGTNGTQNSGWQARGTWTVPAGSTPVVTADSVTPNSGSGTTQTFALAYGDTAGASDLTQVWAWVNATFAGTAANSCLVYYVRGTNTLNLINDAGTAWLSLPLGGGGTLENASCAIALGSTTTGLVGNTLTLNLALTFKAAFAGAKNIFMYATNGSQNSGWQTRGMWTVPASGAAVTADSVTPNTGTGTTQTFALQYSDTSGAVNLTQTWVWFNATFAPTAANSCLAYYDATTGQLNLINDAGTAWLSAALGSGTLQNASCAIALGSSSRVISGNTLTLTLALTFKPAFSGAKTVYMYATNGTLNSDWQTRGNWTVP